jgi:hypothetical protein
VDGIALDPNPESARLTEIAAVRSGGQFDSPYDSMAGRQRPARRSSRARVAPTDLIGGLPMLVASASERVLGTPTPDSESKQHTDFRCNVDRFLGQAEAAV